MAEGKKASSSRGTGLLTTVFIVFLILKLTDTGKVADWPWIYVCMPLIIEAGIIALACCCFCAAVAKEESNRKEAQHPI